MANDTVGRLNVALDMRLNTLEAQIAQANAKVARMSKGMQSDVAKAAKAMNAALSTIGFGISIGALTSFGKSVLDLGGRITDLSNQAGISTEAFQVFSAVASESGVSGEQVAQAFVTMRKSVQDAAAGNASAADSFDKLNLNARALQKLAPEQQFELIAKRIQEARDKNAAFNASLDILGAKNAPKLTEVLQRLANDGYKALADQTERLRLTPEQLKTLDDAGDKLTRIKNEVIAIAAKWSNGPLSALNVAIGSDDKIQNAKDKIAFFSSGLSKNDAYVQRWTEELKRLQVLQEQAKAASDAAAGIASKTGDVESAYAKAKAGLAKGSAGRSKRPEAYGTFSEQLAWEPDAKTADIWAKDAEAVKRYDAALRVSLENEQTAIQRNNEYAADSKVRWEETAQYIDRNMTAVWENVADRAAQSFADILVDGEGTFNQLPKIVARAAVEMAAKLAIINPLLNMIFSLNGTSALPTLFSGVSGARASGGSVSGGSTYLVGEDGPELFTPNSSGYIVPNSRLNSITTNSNESMVVNIDARGADVAAVQRLQIAFAQFNTSFDDRAVSAVSNGRRRMGGLGKSLGA